jgi:ABC-2 type transport system permease protein
LIEDVERGFLRPILVAPVSRMSIVVGKILARLLLSLLLAILMIGTLALFTGFALPHVGIAAYALAAITFGFVALGLLLAIALGRLESFRTIATFVTVPLYLLSGIFFPVESLPGPLYVLALANPHTYGVDLFRYGTTGLAELPLALDVIVAAALAIVPTVLAARAFETRLTD